MPMFGKLLSPGNQHIFDYIEYTKPCTQPFASFQVSATHQRLVLELSDLHAESTDCGEDEQGSATTSNGGVSTVGGGGRGTFDPDLVRHGSGMRFITSQTGQILHIFNINTMLP